MGEPTEETKEEEEPPVEELSVEEPVEVQPDADLGVKPEQVTEE